MSGESPGEQRFPSHSSDDSGSNDSEDATELLHPKSEQLDRHGVTTPGSTVPPTTQFKQAGDVGDLELLEDILSPKGSPVELSVEEEERLPSPPTTIIQPTEEERLEVQPVVSDEVLIPSTVDLSEGGTSLGYKETSAAAYNSFWKYKKFPKGPKVRQTYDLDIRALADPHEPIIFNDPVFDKSQRNVVRHFGKARIGEGNDITPNPEKLAQLGKDIEEINARMMSLGDSTAERKEKMKLSSRICRMKRSANHEANKIKFAGLEKEREEISKVINKVKSALSSTEKVSAERLSEEIYRTRVAGRTSEYVNNVLEQTEQLGGTESYSTTDSESD